MIQGLRRFTYYVTILLTCHVSSGLSQTTDSTNYWHTKYDSAAHKYIIARQCIFNIQDYLDKVQKNKKLGIYLVGWETRMLGDFYIATGTQRPTLVKPIHKHK